MKTINRCFLILLSLAFLMSVGACRHSHNPVPDDANSVRTANEQVSPETNSVVVELTNEQKDSLVKAKQDSIIKAKQDSADQALIGEIAKRIKEMPDSILEGKLHKITQFEERLSSMEKIVYALGGALLIVFLLFVCLFYKYAVKEMKELSDKTGDLDRKLGHVESKQSSLNSRNTRSEGTEYTKEQLKKDISDILDEMGYKKHSNEDTKNAFYEDAHFPVEEETQKKNKAEARTRHKDKDNQPAKELIYLGLPINDLYFQAEEKGESNCFVAEILKDGNSGYFNLISLDRIQSDTISSNVLTKTGKVKLSEAKAFVKEVEGKIVKTEDGFWKVVSPLVITIS